MKSSTEYFLFLVASAAMNIWQKRKLLLLSFFLLSFLQPVLSQTAGGIRVSGSVRDSSGAGVPNVTVSEKGARNSTTTGNDGSFTINVANERSVLVFTSVGYTSQEVRVGSQTTINISFREAESDLSEVVVTGYTSQRRESLTGAIATISSKDLGRVHAGSTVSSGLAGKLPGVTFRMPDGRPGAGANIQIRNMGNPLFVIDGIQQDAAQFNNLAQNDIESISVLKDASAAIYGVRAANGVVVVTTKKGRLNTRSTINVDAYAGAQNWSRFPDVLTNSHDYMTYRAEAEINRFGSTTITPAELEKYKAGTERGYQSFNWRDFIIRKNSPLYSLNLNATGGSDKLNYYLSGTRLYQNSVLGREYLYHRNNIQSNVNAQIANRLKVGMMINGRIEARENPGVPFGDDYFLAKFAIMRNTPLERPYANDNPAYLNDIKHNETNWAYLNYKNAGRYKFETRVMQSNFTGEYQIPGIKGLVAKGIYSYYISDILYNNHEYTYRTYTHNPIDDSYTHTGGSTNPWRERDQIKQINQSTQAQLNYNNTFGDHTVGAVVVTERILNHRRRNWIKSTPSSNALFLIYLNTADRYEDFDDKEARIGYIGRFNYSLMGRYFLELSARRDASYLFAPDKRVGYFPSVSAGWRITDEPFMQKMLGDQSFLNDLKLRGSYGVLGDDGTALGLAPFSYLEGYNYQLTNIAILDNRAVIGSRDRGLPITNITWLKSKITDIGADFTFLNRKLTGSADYFYRKRTGLRGRRNDLLIPVEAGITLPDENLNSDAQYGYEGALNYNGRAGRVSFNIGGNASYSRSKFLASYNPVFFHSLDRYRNSLENRYLRINWGYEVAGQFKSQDEINNYQVNIDGQGNRTLLPGDLIYKDQNGDGKIDAFDERPIGYGSANNQPNINFGLTFGAGFKGFDFSADFSGGAGYTWFQNFESRWAFQNDGNLNTIFLDRWRRADMYDRNSAWIPGKYPANRFNDRNHSNYTRTSNFWAHNVKYLRARTLELGYSMSSTLLDKMKMQRARFYINAYNLFSFDNLKNYNVDPEVHDENGLQYPQNKFVNVGVNLSF